MCEILVEALKTADAKHRFMSGEYSSYVEDALRKYEEWNKLKNIELKVTLITIKENLNESR